MIVVLFVLQISIAKYEKFTMRTYRQVYLTMFFVKIIINKFPTCENHPYD